MGCTLNLQCATHLYRPQIHDCHGDMSHLLAARAGGSLRLSRTYSHGWVGVVEVIHFSIVAMLRPSPNTELANRDMSGLE